MGIEQKLCERIDNLLQKGEQVLSTHKSDPPNVIGFPALDHGSFVEWQTQSLAFLASLLPEDHPYITQFRAEVQKGYRSHVRAGMGILRALREDIVQADVLTDFLDMALHLLESGYKDAAALLTGAVLEGGLRQSTISRNVTAKNSENISALDQQCVNESIYSRLIQKKMQTWNDIRNNAAHGHFDQYTVEDIKLMLEGVRDFLASYLREAG